MKVILIDPCTRIDVTAAKRHGELITLFEKGRQRPSIWADTFLDACIERLDEINFDHELDAILVAGATVPVVKLVSFLVAHHEKIRVLCHNAPVNDYILQEVGYV